MDLRVYPDGGYKILDTNEYNYHKKKMKYPDTIDRIVKKELAKLIELKKEKKGPFDEKVIEKYKNIYLNINKNM